MEEEEEEKEEEEEQFLQFIWQLQNSVIQDQLHFSTETPSMMETLMSSAKEPMSNMVMVVKLPQLVHQMMHHRLYHLVSVTNAKYGHGGQLW